MPNMSKKVFDSLISKTKIYLIIIAILLIVVCILKIELIMPAVIAYSLILVYTFFTNNKRKNEISEHIRDLTLTVDSAAKSTLINSPFPLVILETDGNIIWRSSIFNNEFANIDINNYLNEISKEIKQIINNQEKKKSVETEIQIGEKTYKIIGEYVKSKQRKKESEYMTILYFIDETKHIKTLKKYEDSKMCIGIIMVDNYEEIMQKTTNEDRPQVLATIEKNIYEWASVTNGLVIKSDRDTFVFVFEQRYLKQLQDNRFNILDNIKEVNIVGKLQITLSIAISNEGNSNYEKYKSALATMDIALGRGGDQAIIRFDGKYNFFGGRAQEVEKRTKVKARIIAHALEELMLGAENIIIMGHSNGDIDSMGSSLGLLKLAMELGKEGYIVNNTYGLTLENFMDTIKKDKQYKDKIIDKNKSLDIITQNSLLIVVDAHKTTYVEVPELLEKTSKIVIIDHHRRSTDYIESAILTFHEVYASSASELVTELLQYTNKKVELSELEAQALYAGIMIDTKNFTFKTGVRTFEAAAYLRKSGVDIIKVKKWFQSDLKNYNIISEIVKKAEIVNETVGISMYEKEDKNAGLICAKAADELLTISNITASFVIGNLGDKICISGRSIGDINVQVILEKLGGGGHITLAGAQVEGMTQQEVKQELIIRINEYFTEISS